jgi:hypothetical protein
MLCLSGRSIQSRIYAALALCNTIAERSVQKIFKAGDRIVKASRLPLRKEIVYEW